MSHRLRQGLFVAGLLVLLLVAGAQAWLLKQPRQWVEMPLDQTSAAPSAPHAAAVANETTATSAKETSSQTVRVYNFDKLELRPTPVPVPADSEKTAVEKPATSNPALPRNEKLKPRPASPGAKAAAAPLPVPHLNRPAESPSTVPPKPGEMPGLIVDFSGLGFARYVQFVEQAGGTFFAYRGSDGLGPRLSLTRQRAITKGNDSDLATDRPYLVSDPGVTERLAALDLPEGTSRSSVVMLWPKWLDRAVWNAITQALAEGRVRLEEVRQVDASVLDHGTAIDLHIESYALRNEGQRMVLSVPRTIRVKQ